jgi:hypothetical protein
MGSSSDDWIYYQLVTHSLLTMLTQWQYSIIYHLHNLQFTTVVFFHHELPSYLSPAENLSGNAESYFEPNCFENRTEMSSYQLILLILKLNWLHLELVIITAAPTTQKTSLSLLLKHVY